MNVQQQAPTVIRQVWENLGEDRRRLRLAPRLVAFSRSGEPIVDFDAEYRRWLAEAPRLAPKENPRSFASRTVGADPRTIREDTPVIDVVRIGGTFLTTCSNYLVRDTPVDVARSLDEACERGAERAQTVFAAAEVQRAFRAPRPGFGVAAAMRTRRAAGFGALLVIAGIALVSAQLPIVGGALIGAGLVLLAGGFR